LNFDRIDLTSNPNIGNIEEYGENTYDSEGPKNGYFNLEPSNKVTSKNSSPQFKFGYGGQEGEKVE
tara:strand:- start:1644 stop:1841 length:198 start_codon:yes stop_codon:yes gene_type:complete